MLLFFPKPYPQETLLSFIYRVAIEHEMGNLDWIFELILRELSIYLKPEEVNRLKGNELKSVAKFLGITLKEAEDLTICKYFERYHIDVCNESKNTVFLYKKTRFCPLCLKDGVYQRKSWISCHSIMCTEHNVMLNDRCYICVNIPNTKSIILDKCLNCNNKLSNSPIKMNFPNKFIEYQQVLDHILEIDSLSFSHPWINNPSTFIETLDFLALWAAKLIPTVDLSIFKYNLNYEGTVLERNHLKNFRTVEQTACLFTYVFNIITNWPNEFEIFIRKSEISNTRSLQSFIKYGIPRIINTPLWEVSKAFTNYVAIEKGNLAGNQYVRSDEVRFLYPKFNGGIVNSPQVKSQEINILNSSIIVIDRVELDIFMNTFEKSYNKEELRAIWGTSAKATFAILNAGLIDRAFYFKSGSVYNWVIPRNSINIFENRLKQASTTNISNPITFNHTAEWIGPDKANLLIKKMLHGSLKFKYKDKLYDSLLDKKETYYQIKEEIFRLSKKSKVISYRDATFILGVKQSDIQYWISKGRLGRITNDTPNGIPFHNFLDFHERFITTLELAFKLNLTVKQVTKKYSLGKLFSVSGPKFNDGERLLFIRNHIN